ncbi:MAG: ribulose phosphate epimerase [Chloroflexi bacterium]|nr:ribulose phosphate epimerase [Chloroflexota bacterium]|tara:strand:- start:110939 stop:111751 length:813 start_codon:yes stop_codon:yes gene_type:complete
MNSKNIKCPVVLSFDIDGTSGLINMDPRTKNFPSLMSMREYGPNIAMPRILKILKKHDIKSSFYIPGFIADTHPELVKNIFYEGHEIGHHGYMHEPPATLTKQEEIDVIDKGIESIERITSQIPLGYRSPSWELSKYSIDILVNKGFVYDSSLMGDDRPYYIQSGKNKLIEIPIHWELDDHPYFNHTPYLNQRNVISNPMSVLESWQLAFEGIFEYQGSFILTLHPWIIGRPGRLKMLEKLILYIKKFDGAEFITALNLAKLFDSQIVSN